MKKISKSKSLLVTPQDEPNVADLINKMQQQLNDIEKKLDTLISQSLKKSFEKSYSQKPSSHFNRSQGYNRGGEGSDSRGKNFTRAICADCNKECEIPFRPSGGRPVYCRECFSKHRKDSPFSGNRNSRSGNRYKPTSSRKPFFKGRKKHA